MKVEPRYTAPEIAAAFDLSVEQVLRALKQHNRQLPLPIASTPKIGRPIKGQTKRTSERESAESQAAARRRREMRRLRSQGLTLQEIGDRYGLTRERVRQILSRGKQVDKNLVGMSEAQQMLGLGRRAIEQAICDGVISPIRNDPHRVLFRRSELKNLELEPRRCAMCGAVISNPCAWRYCSADCRNEAHSYRYWPEEKRQRQRERIEQWKLRNPEKARQIQKRSNRRHQLRAKRAKRIADIAYAMSGEARHGQD